MKNKKRERRMMPPSVRTGGIVALMVIKDSYAMVRRPGCTPFVVSQKEWESWEIVE